jgi:hypothetical protein
MMSFSATDYLDYYYWPHTLACQVFDSIAPNLLPTIKMTDPQLEQIAQEKYGKSFDELEAREKQSVGGIKGGHAGEWMAWTAMLAIDRLLCLSAKKYLLAPAAQRSLLT